MSQLFSSSVANSNTCAGVLNITGNNNSTTASVPEFVEQDSTIFLMNTEVIGNPITDSVVAVNDVSLQWLPQDETLLQD